MKKKKMKKKILELEKDVDGLKLSILEPSCASGEPKDSSNYLAEKEVVDSPPLFSQTEKTS